ncbi:hypothetical protein D477_005571 [Arthrobacter crystallopoietes BAB-32]|uniref:Uncharacterized protein n=1 Tax=Arthrobacter crystallopoietes BAB-32 TaxID=1246476 RepID=N1V5B7_9MICC|nr:hypothetical protein [Arthrobacter crystallopoietes]EMY35209.1 hypothetical protein D477_005571 [Arthrobacter crystallopoietes BAB-32]
MANNYVRGASITSAASRAEIHDMLTRCGATGFRCGSEDGRTAITFTAGHRQFRFVYVPPGSEGPGTGKPVPGAKSHEDASRRYWHKLSMLIQAKLEAVAAGVATFEEEFLAYMVVPGGETVFQNVESGIAKAYATGVRRALLNDGGR